MNSCNDFRLRLEQTLLGQPDPERASRLAWHEHLNGCPACRAILEAEEALEHFLASLPAPTLPADLTARVLARLSAEREAVLDELLELDEVASAPDLSDRVLAGLGEDRAREAELRRLDTLLARVEAPDTPVDLPDRVLHGLAKARTPRSRLALLRGGGITVRASVGAAAAAALVLIFSLWKLGQGADEGQDFRRADDVVVEVRPEPQTRGGDFESEPDREMLAALDVLEEWDLLLDEDIDVLLASLDPVEEELLNLAYDEEDGG